MVGGRGTRDQPAQSECSMFGEVHRKTVEVKADRTRLEWTTYLRSAPREAHLCVLAGFGRERGQASGHGVLRPSRGTKVPDLQ